MIDWLQAHLGMNPQLQTRLVVTAGTIAGLWLVRHFVLGFVYRRVQDPWGRYRWRKGLTYVLVAVGVILVSQTWFVGTSALTTYLGLVSAGLAIALKEPVSNVAGWAFIIWRRPFEVGDRVQIGPHAGDVKIGRAHVWNSSHSQISYAVFCLKKKKMYVKRIIPA